MVGMRDRNDPPGPRTRLMQELGSLVLGGIREAVTKSSSPLTKSSAPLSRPNDEPPVVAQLMIEIRSDGSRTIARGALHDLRNDEHAEIHAEGKTPSDLILSLLGSLFSLPSSTLQLLRSRTSVDDPKPGSGKKPS
jgi:hypothetical protein